MPETTWAIQQDVIYITDDRHCSLLGIIPTSGDPRYPDKSQLVWLSQPGLYVLQFATKLSAELFIGMLETLHDSMPYRETLQGLRHGEAPATVVDYTAIDKV